MARETFRVNVLPNQGLGARYGVTRSGFGGTYPEGYDGAFNMTCHSGRSFSPSFSAARVFHLASRRPPVAVVPWEDDAGRPIAVVLVDSRARRMQDAGITDETDATSEDYRSAALFDDGAGNPILLAGTDTGSLPLQRRTLAGVWNTFATPARFVVAAGQDFYRVVNDYQVRKWNGTTPPTTNANYGAPYNVGSASSRFTAAGALGDAPVFGKSDGKLYMFDERAEGFRPIFETSPHEENFPAIASDGFGGVVTATWDGSLVQLTRDRDVHVYRVQGWSDGRDTARLRWASFAAVGGELYGLAWPAQRMTQRYGLRVFETRDVGVSYEERTEVLTDQRADTYLDLEGFETLAHGHWLLARAEAPYFSLYFDVLEANTAASRLRTRLVTANDLSGIDMTNEMFNGTDLDPVGAGQPFGQSGWLAIWPVGVSMFFGPFGAPVNPWQEVTLTINGEAIAGWWWMLYLE